MRCLPATSLHKHALNKFYQKCSRHLQASVPDVPEQPHYQSEGMLYESQACRYNVDG